MHPAIRPTVTHEVRAFLEAEGAAIRPWAGLDETYAELYALLSRRRSDPAFWGPLTRLLEAVVADAADADRRGKLPAPGAELLSRWEVDDLVRELRDALPEDGSPSRRWRPFASGLSATVLGGFLLLGLAAAGCASGATAATAEDGPAAAPAGGTTTVVAAAVEAAPPTPPVEVAPAQACALEASSVLRRTIEGSSLPEAERAELCRCFASLGGNWSEGLTELFESASAAEIAAALEAMVDRCDDEDPTAGQAFAEVTDQRLRPTRPEPPRQKAAPRRRPRPRQPTRPVEVEFAPLYKGVSFRQ